MMNAPVSRRAVLRLALGGGASLALLAACGGDDPTATPAPVATPAPQAAQPAATPAPPAPTAPPAATATTATRAPSADGAQVLVSDVVDYMLDANGRWDGPFGSVTLKIHHGYFDGDDVWFIRTDASDAAFARDNGLVFVPILANALNAPDGTASIYLFEDQGAVVTSTPGDEQTYTPAFRVHRVTGATSTLTSEADILAAQSAGTIEIEETDIVVNYPLVAWPGGSLAVDTDLMEPLGSGPLVEPIDERNETVTFKLHECFPGSRYIVTDTSAVPMAPMMGIVGSGFTQALQDVNAVAPITIFLNGLPGPGVMGFQPAIFNESAGHPAWSPFWDHFAVEWADPEQATVVRSQSELDALVASGDLILYNGVPDTHPMGFVVNCPAPILAPNTYTG
jgi:hypothetical protein